MRAWPVVWALWAALAAQPGVAQQGATQLGVSSSGVVASAGGEAVYRLRPGDALPVLAARFLQDGVQALPKWLALNGLAGAHEARPGMALRVPRHWLQQQPSMAVVRRTNCSSVLRQEGEQSVPVKAGDALYEGTLLRVPPGCQLVLAFEDASSLRLMPGSALALRVLRRNRVEPSPEVRLELLDGRLEVEVPHKRGADDAPFEVRSPTSLAGVRGTGFSMGFNGRRGESQVEVQQGLVAAGGRAEGATSVHAAAGQGLPVRGDGRALALETLLPAPRWRTATALADGRWTLAFDEAQDVHYWLVRESADASFAFFGAQETLLRPQLGPLALSQTAVFLQWQAVSRRGIQGHAARYGFCQGFRSLDEWRCHVPLNVTGLTRPRLQLLRQDQGGERLVMDSWLSEASPEPEWIRGLPAGQYRWRLEVGPANDRSSMRGEFELVVLAGQS